MYHPFRKILWPYRSLPKQRNLSVFLALPLHNTEGFQLFLNHFAAAYPTEFHLLLLDNGACHKARHLHVPANLGLLFFPPYAPELNPIERLWRDHKDRLATPPSTTLDGLFTRLMTWLTHYTPAVVRSLPGFPYFLAMAQIVNG